MHALKIRRSQGLTSSSLVSGTSEVVEEFGGFDDEGPKRRGRYLGASRFRRAPGTELPRLLRVVEAAALLAISRRHLATLIARGEVSVARLGKCVRVPRAEVDRLCIAGALGG